MSSRTCPGKKKQEHVQTILYKACPACVGALCIGCGGGGGLKQGRNFFSNMDLGHKPSLHRCHGRWRLSKNCCTNPGPKIRINLKKKHHHRKGLTHPAGRSGSFSCVGCSLGVLTASASGTALAEDGFEEQALFFGIDFAVGLASAAILL